MNQRSEEIMEPLPDSPLVSFVVLTYNHERYVEQAMKAALHQDYPNLEIVVSDDHSSDGTWTIVESLAKNESTAHRLVLNRNSINLGIGAHIAKLAELASGDIIVLAGGDDIAVGHRTSVLANAFMENDKVQAVFSDYTRINADGDLMECTSASHVGYGASVCLEKMIRSSGGVGAGATYAYRRQCFHWPTKYPVSIACEDKLLPFRAACLGQVRYIDLKLVFYRNTPGSLWKTIGTLGKQPCRNPAHLMVLEEELNAAMKAGAFDKKDYVAWSKILRRNRWRAVHWRVAAKVGAMPVIGKFLASAYRVFWFRLLPKF